MPNRGTLNAVEGETRGGTQRSIGKNCWHYIEAPTGKVGGFAFQLPNGTTLYMWADDTNDIRVSLTEPTTPNSDGAVVGTQS